MSTEEIKAYLSQFRDDNIFGMIELLRRGVSVEELHGITAVTELFLESLLKIVDMEKRLAGKPHECQFQPLLYEHGTHFVFPQSMLKKILPIASGLFVGLFFKAGRDYPKECLQTRKDIDEKLSTAIARWRHFP